MKKILNSGLALTLLVVASLSAHAQGLLYITDNSGKLGTVNLANDSVTVLGNSSVVLRDIGFTANGNLYGNTLTGLYTVNTVTAATTLVGNFSGGQGGGTMVGLNSYKGTMLVADSSTTNQIYVVNTAPMTTTTLTGTLTGKSSGDLTFGTNGLLYDVLSTGVLDQITINSAGTGFTAVAVGSTGNTGITGLATDPTSGKTYAIAGTEIYTIDLNTAALTPFFNYGGHGLGTDTGAAIASLAVVPEPSNVAMLLTGLAGLVLYQRRRSLANQA